MKVVCISDTHDALDKIDIPEGDILLHAGDATGIGSVPQISKFNEDLGKIKNRFTHGIYYTPGNHDLLFEDNQALARDIITNATVLIHESIDVAGFKMFFSPYTPWFGDWAFNLDRGPMLKSTWDEIPDDTDVLITHGPPYGILDKVYRTVNEDEDPLVGCEELIKAVQRVKPRLHVFGHIHEAQGVHKTPDTIFVNASIMTLWYKPLNKPVEVEL